MFELKDLSNCRVDDSEKIALIKEASSQRFLCESHLDFDFATCAEFYDISLPETKYCPECGRKFPEKENVCLDCLVHLKNLSDTVDVQDIKSNPQFVFKGENNYSTFDELLSDENLSKINQFNFNIDDYKNIIHGIKSQAFKNFDEIVKSNDLHFDSLEILDKVLLFAKSIVKVDYKSSGSELGYFENKTIYIDDRQSRSLQITTIIHELSHFLLQEILTQIICQLLNTTKNTLTESLAVFVLSFEGFTRLIDEYSAHNVEGRFTVFGFQDYSSFEQIERELDGKMAAEEIDITKSIGNNFAIYIKDILEALIDRSLREDIKEQFISENFDKPNYKALEMENCQILNDEAFIKAIWLMLHEGCEVASLNKEKLISLNKEMS